LQYKILKEDMNVEEDRVVLFKCHQYLKAVIYYISYIKTLIYIMFTGIIASADPEKLVCGLIIN